MKNQLKSNYTISLIIITALFFVYEFITCMNEILIPYLKQLFNAPTCSKNIKIYSNYDIISNPYNPDILPESFTMFIDEHNKISIPNFIF
ncbi:hypothetical protein [Sphingobacterium multivorum]|uniref:hypothetical protein n=1 Tax=Sphingobacterium multivorum TaxID=28454 RepID=UPI00289AD40F|nr:hypothetical protein [Sphingobacterium multivorum]